MIRITARNIVRKEHIPQYQKLVKELVEATRKEDGCVMYTSNQSIKDERVHCFIEEWRDQAAVDRHMASEHYQRIIPQLAGLFESEKLVDLYRPLF